MDTDNFECLNKQAFKSLFWMSSVLSNKKERHMWFAIWLVSESNCRFWLNLCICFCCKHSMSLICSFAHGLLVLRGLLWSWVRRAGQTESWLYSMVFRMWWTHTQAWPFWRRHRTFTHDTSQRYANTTQITAHYYCKIVKMPQNVFSGEIFSC